MRLLDLFCGAGGAAMGYSRAGFTEIVGIDIKPQKRYPFEFHQGDALEWCAAHYHAFDAIHASPPCQAHTAMSNRWRGKGGKADSHADLIAPVQSLLLATGRAWVIENVVGAPMRGDVVLAGGMFGLGVHRPRLFDSSVLLLAPSMSQPPAGAIGVYGRAHDGRLLWRRRNGTEQRAASSLAQAGEAMGIDWMEWRELAESIPPSYSEFIGRQLLDAIRCAA